ncbi:MAG: universal stress protein [Alphaproteobacteria bacterium]
MAIKTLLVHLTPEADSLNRLNIAANLTKSLDGHLVCLYVAHPVHLPSGIEGRGASLSYLAESKKLAVKKQDEMHQQVKDICGQNDISFEWVFDHEDHLESLLAVVHHVDLTIVGRVQFNHLEDRLLHNFVEELIMKAGGPVLMLPANIESFSFDGVKNILIAWNYSAQSIRAIRDYMEFVQKADKVLLVEGGIDKQSANLDAIDAYLARHGVSNIKILNHDMQGHAGDEILEIADHHKVDAIIMGAYGHHGILDRLIGSATRWVISHSDVPLLLSH